MSNSLSKQEIESLAPDQSSLSAALKLLKPKSWDGRETDNSLIWAACQGSGANPYKVVFDLRDHGYKCTCPSRKFPCKHVLALTLFYAEEPADFSTANVPDWIGEWMGRRRSGGEKPPPPNKKQKQSESKDKSLDAALLVEAETRVDPEQEAKKEIAREKRQAETAASITSGLHEFEAWVGDVLQTGVMKVIPDLVSWCRRIAARLVDAKASALASRIDELPAFVLSLPPEAQPDALIDALGKLLLLSRAWSQPEATAGVKRLIQSTETREEVLNSSDAERVQAIWQVISTRSSMRKDGMLMHATWLMTVTEPLRFALLLDFMPAAVGRSGSGLAVGEVFDAEIVFYPSAYPLRGFFVERTALGGSGQTGWAKPSMDIFETIQDALHKEPWLEEIPIFLPAGRLVYDKKEALFWQSEDQDLVLPLRQTELSTSADSLLLMASAALWRCGRIDLLVSNTEFGFLYND